ncbi:MAG TPA: hypothetical protein VM659_15105 [Dongiaceae bacterium]|nr:hypothetical protein [Dongiaceae bacterium]
MLRQEPVVVQVARGGTGCRRGAAPSRVNPVAFDLAPSRLSPDRLSLDRFSLDGLSLDGLSLDGLSLRPPSFNLAIGGGGSQKTHADIPSTSWNIGCVLLCPQVCLQAWGRWHAHADAGS